MRKRPFRFELCFTADELESLNEKAQRAGMTKADFIRAAIENATFKEASPPEYMELISRLKQTGSALDQLSKLASSKGLDETEIQKALYENFKAEQMLWDNFVPGKH